MRVKIEGTKYSRDLSNMAVLCHDKSEVVRYESDVKKHKQNQARDEELNNIRNEIAELKSLMQVLIRGQNG